MLHWKIGLAITSRNKMESKQNWTLLSYKGVKVAWTSTTLILIMGQIYIPQVQPNPDPAAQGPRKQEAHHHQLAAFRVGPLSFIWHVRDWANQFYSLQLLVDYSGDIW